MFYDAIETTILTPVVQKMITDYFKGSYVDFKNCVSLDLDSLTTFNRRVLAACSKIRAGQTLSYSQIAEKIGSPGAARAVGTALAKNPLPLIIPCHRVIKTDGQIGQFSAAGDENLKEKLLKHEILY